MKNFQFSIFNFQKNGGFTIFIAIIVASTLLLIVAGVTSLAVRQSLISSTGRESQYAFYAADSGMECALYWDVKNFRDDTSAFATSTGVPIFCNNSGNLNVGGNPQSTFTFTLSPDSSCATVTVSKFYQGSNLVTSIESRGYNTCDSANSRRVERALRAVY